jgi:hypothetical protein
MGKNSTNVSKEELESLETSPREFRQFVKDSERAQEEATKRMVDGVAEPPEPSTAPRFYPSKKDTMQG